MLHQAHRADRSQRARSHDLKEWQPSARIERSVSTMADHVGACTAALMPLFVAFHSCNQSPLRPPGRELRPRSRNLRGVGAGLVNKHQSRQQTPARRNNHARRKRYLPVRAAALRRGRNTTKCDMEKLTAKVVRMAQPLAGSTGTNCAATTNAVVFAMTPRIPEATNVP